MTFLRRLILLILLFAAPAALTWLLHAGTLDLLDRFRRTVDPDTLTYMTAGEFVLFFLISGLEVRDRW